MADARAVSLQQLLQQMDAQSEALARRIADADTQTVQLAGELSKVSNQLEVKLVAGITAASAGGAIVVYEEDAELRRIPAKSRACKHFCSFIQIRTGQGHAYTFASLDFSYFLHESSRVQLRGCRR